MVSEKGDLSSNIGACEVCGEPATCSVRADLFGKSDAMRNLCGKHAPRLRDPQDVTEIERLRAALSELVDCVGGLSDPEDNLSCIPHGPEAEQLHAAWKAGEATLAGMCTPETSASHRGPYCQSKPGDWMDGWGACKVCGGEIPDGHITECAHWKLQVANRRMREALQQWRDACSCGCDACVELIETLSLESAAEHGQEKSAPPMPCRGCGEHHEPPECGQNGDCS